MMDFLSLIGDSRRYTFHSHTQFCDGHATMAEFAAEAVKQGFTHYGFSPHSPIPIASPCNMSMEDVAAYFSEFRRLREQYEGYIHLYAGMEIDYLDEEWGPSVSYFDTLPLDYRIGSVHFIPSQEGSYVDVDGRFESFQKKMSEFFHEDIHYVVETFYRQSARMIDAGGFDIIGHFDKIGHNAAHYRPGIEGEDWYKRLVNDLIEQIISSGITVELNTKAWDEHHRTFPDVAHLKPLLEAKVPIIVNSDAHYPGLINAGREHGFELLDSMRKK